MTEIKQIDNRIKQLRNDLDNVHGTKTEVYTRIVGYYRSVKGWNAGKRAELKIRKYFNESNERRI